MQNIRENGIAPETVDAAEALTTLVSLGSGEQYVAPRGTSIITGADRTELHSIFTPGRLRGTMHYEATYATMTQDNLGKFLKAISQDPARAEVVRSVKLDLVCDNFLHSGVAELINEDILPFYTFTDDASSGPYPPLTEAALLLKDIQRRMANDPGLSRHPLCPVDLTLLKKDFLYEMDFATNLLATHLDLLIKLCPNLQIIQLPAQWCPILNLPFNATTLTKWKDVHKWELEIKEFVQDDFVRIGKKDGYSVAHVQRWMQQVAEDIVKNG
ncbi:hypothetical protein P171DRAFT_446896 [Karstenula rhodostoma CBS 690.94]|uniref:Uncharacterized protein n=1 Tax=Karstenula rhodostoma CBS 690.94 TaxID=1392251 RepID=A0A9P4PDC3_9PLEO|nr:hypothetical protein P171DRAFT_446896 [Karstenula rhodostoma CBS 690.94]